MRILQERISDDDDMGDAVSSDMQCKLTNWI